MKLSTLLTMVVCGIGLAGTAQAATITASNGGQVIASPATVGEDDPTNTVIQAYNEITGYTLLANLDVDGPDIAAGTRVDSHMVFLNSPGNQRIDTTARFTFSQKILGVMTQTNGTQMFASDAFLGGPVSYVGAVPGTYGGNRGFEPNNPDSVTFVSPFTIDVRMLVTEPGDWMRVVTMSAVPLPAGAVLLPAAFGLLAGLRRRKQAQKR